MGKQMRSFMYWLPVEGKCLTQIYTAAKLRYPMTIFNPLFVDHSQMYN